MPVIDPVCGGIAVHAAQLAACPRRGSGDGHITTELHDSGTNARDSAVAMPRCWLAHMGSAKRRVSWGPPGLSPAAGRGTGGRPRPPAPPGSSPRPPSWATSPDTPRRDEERQPVPGGRQS